MSWNCAGIWIGESVRETFRPEKARPCVMCEYEVAETPEGCGWAFRFGTANSGHGQGIAKRDVVPTREEAVSKAVNGLGNALASAYDYSLAYNGAESEKARLRKLLDWLAKKADALAPSQGSLFEAVTT